MDGAVTVVMLLAVSVSLTARVKRSPCTTLGSVMLPGSIVYEAVFCEMLPNTRVAMVTWRDACQSQSLVLYSL